MRGRRVAVPNSSTDLWGIKDVEAKVATLFWMVASMIKAESIIA